MIYMYAYNNIVIMLHLGQDSKMDIKTKPENSILTYLRTMLPQRLFLIHAPSQIFKLIYHRFFPSGGKVNYEHLNFTNSKDIELP